MFSWDSVCLSVCLCAYICLFVYLVITSWSQSTIATHLRDESCVDQEQRHRCSGREHARCPGTDKPPTASAVTEMMSRSGNSRVIAVTVLSVFHLSWFYSYVCNCPVFRHCICTLRYSWPIGILCSLFSLTDAECLPLNSCVHCQSICDGVTACVWCILWRLLIALCF